MTMVDFVDYTKCRGIDPYEVLEAYFKDTGLSEELAKCIIKFIVVLLDKLEKSGNNKGKELDDDDDGTI